MASEFCNPDQQCARTLLTGDVPYVRGVECFFFPGGVLLVLLGSSPTRPAAAGFPGTPDTIALHYWRALVVFGWDITG